MDPKNAFGRLCRDVLLNYSGICMDLLRKYSARTYSYDYSAIIDEVIDYGTAYNQVIEFSF